MVEALFPREHTMSASILSMMLACVGFLCYPWKKSGRWSSACAGCGG